MPLYEFVLRVGGRPDEVRISDHNGLRKGDAITIAGRRWIVADKEPPPAERPDRLAVDERIVLVRKDRVR